MPLVYTININSSLTNMNVTLTSTIRIILLLLLTIHLTGCVFWRLFQTKKQMEMFDQNFEIVIDDKFSLLFKNPLITRDDLRYLSKLQPSQKSQQGGLEVWTSIFRKADGNNKILEPEISFFWEMTFNQDGLLSSWALSPLFLQIAPADFLEASLRAMGGAKIYEGKRQIKVDLESVDKLVTALPKRTEIEKKLGKPLSITQKNNNIRYVYRFILDSPNIEPGYEDRTITKIELYFNQHSDDLIKMSGRFVGMKIAIDYRKLVAQKTK